MRLGLLLLLMWPGALFAIEEIKLGTTLGSALVAQPVEGRPRMAAIYHHGLIVEQEGIASARKRGYAVSDYVEALALEGAAALAPLRTKQIDPWKQTQAALSAAGKMAGQLPRRI